MAMIAMHNGAAALALNETNKNNKAMNKAFAKVASGMKINSAEDGAAEYAIGKRMEVMVRALGQDIQNTRTGRNLVNTAEGGIQSIVDNLRDMKSMAINAANDHNSDLDREIIEKDFFKRMDTIRDVASTTNYNGRYLLRGDYREDYHLHTCESKPIFAPSITLNGITAGTKIKIEADNGVGGIKGYTLTKVNAIDDLTKNFSPENSDTISLGQIRSYGGTLCEGYRYSAGSTASNKSVKMDFSALNKNGNAPNLPADLNDQGFTVLCAGCMQFINITFDSSRPVSGSTYASSVNGGNSDREFVIGVRDVTNINQLAETIFNGLKEMAARPKTYSEDGNGYTIEGENTALLDDRHAVRMEKGKDGNYYLYKERQSPDMGIFDQGTFISQVQEGSTLEGVPVKAGEYTVQNNDPVLTRIIGYDLIEHNIDKEGVPLIIHTGPKSNQCLRVFINSMMPDDMGIINLRLNPLEAAVSSLVYLDDALNYALNENTRMGAYQSRLEKTDDNLVTVEENTTSSLSVIRDADMAKEMTEYTKYNILTQSSQAMLAQANQNGSKVLSLLQ